MTYLRHATRHLQATVTAAVRGQLVALGWTAEPGPFGVSGTRIEGTRLRESDAVTGTLFAITFGDEPDEEPREMGGGLVSVEHAVFVDCVAEEESISLAMACDVKDFLSGRAPGTSRFLPLRDFTSTAAGVVVPEHTLEMVDVVRDKPGGPDWRRRWHVVKATVVHYSPGTD